MLARVYRATGGKIPLIGIGGIDSGAAALAKIRAGATLIQLYTGLIYQGPGLIGRIKEQGGWKKTETVLGYIDEANAGDADNAASGIGL